MDWGRFGRIALFPCLLIVACGGRDGRRVERDGEIVAQLTGAAHPDGGQAASPAPADVPDSPPVPGACGWTSIGPTNLNGRVNSIAIDPNDNQRVYAATVGGFWRSFDGGRRWERTSDDTLPVQSVDNVPPHGMSAVAVHPGNGAEILAGVGDISAFAGGGILRSPLAGERGSWVDENPETLWDATVYKIVYSTAPPYDVYIASSAGVFKGAHVENTIQWSLLDGFDATTSDIAIDDDESPPVVYAGVWIPKGPFVRSVWKHDGVSWAPSTTGIDTSNAGRIALALAPSAPQILYARIVNESTGHLLGLYKTDDGAASWSIDSAPGVAALDDMNGRSDYVSALEVDPSDPEIVYATGLNLWRRDPSGWASVSAGGDTSYPLTIHVDQHAVAIVPTPPHVVFVGNDGGIYKSSGPIEPPTPWHWTESAHGMVITEFYASTSQLSSPSVVAGGSQDNGLDLTYGNRTWYSSALCDGKGVAFDAENASTLYGACTGEGGGPLHVMEIVKFYQTQYGAVSEITGQWSLPAGIGRADLPVVTDPTVAGVALMAGIPTANPTSRVLLRTTNGLDWNTVLATPEGARISAAAISTTDDPTTSQKVYYVGARHEEDPLFSGWIASSDNEGQDWTFASGLPAQFTPRAVAVDPTNARGALAFVNAVGGDHLYVTSDGGASWGEVTPTGATWAGGTTGLVIDPYPLQPNVLHLYVATQVGVFKGIFSPSLLQVYWESFDEGLPNATEVNGIAFDQATGTLTIGTFGHGAYQRNISPGATCPDVMLVVRDNVLDRGMVPSPTDVGDPEHPIPTQPDGFFKPDDTPGGMLRWWKSTDIRIDIPSAAAPKNAIDTADSVEFESCPVHFADCPAGTMVDRAPRPDQLMNAYVQVANRGLVPATDVRVMLLRAAIASHVPDLPPDFWISAFPEGLTTCGDVAAGSGWTKIGCANLDAVNPEMPEVAQLPWTEPSLTSLHQCYLAIVDSPADPIGAGTRNTFDIATLVPNDRHIAQRNIHLIDSPPLLHFSGLTWVNVANLSHSDGVDLLVSRGPSDPHRLQILLPLRERAPTLGTLATTDLTGLPLPCSTASEPNGGVLSVQSTSGAHVGDQALGAARSMWLGARARVLENGGGFASIANAGDHETVIGPSAQLGTVTSVGSVFLRSRAEVQGDLRTAGALFRWPGASVSGTVEEGATLLPLETVGIPIPSANGSGDTIWVLPHQTRELAPGTYGTARVLPGGTLVLQAGTYVFDELEARPLSRVRIDGVPGAVAIYVASRMHQGGLFVDGTGGPAEVSLIYAGDRPVTLTCPFRGSVIAPHARMALAPCHGDSYAGWFYANDLVVLPGATVRHEGGSTLAGLAACSPLTEAERAEALALGLNPDELYGVGTEVNLHLPVPPGSRWTIGLRYESDARPTNESSRFEVVQSEGRRVVGGNSFIIRYQGRNEVAR